MLTVTPQLKKQIKEILETGLNYCEFMKEKHNESPDVLFLVTAYKTKFDELNDKFTFNKEIDLEEFSENISNFESGLFAWYESLDHNMFGDGMRHNSLYTVLYAVLAGIDRVLEEALIIEQDSIKNDDEV